MTDSRRNDIIENAIKWSYIYSFATSDQTVISKAQKRLVTYYPEMFGEKFEEASKFVDDTYVEEELQKVDGKYPTREYDKFMESINNTVLSNMKPFMKLTDEEKKAQEEVVDVIPEYEPDVQEVQSEKTEKVDGTPADVANNMAKIDFGFGTPFDPEQINKEMAEQFDPSNPARAFLQKPTEFQQPMPEVVSTPPMGFATPQPIPGVFFNPQMIPVPHNPHICTDPNCGCHTHPVHKVDEPPKPKKVIPPEDTVNHNLDETINIDSLKKDPIVKQIPEIVHPLENVPKTPNIVTNMYDNTAIANKFTKIPLLEIQAIANHNGCSVKFDEYPHDGIISVSTFDHAVNQPVAPKSFCIDTGMIIDKRVKLIATNPVFNQELMLEQAPIYELFMATGNAGKKSLDEKMINDIFIAGTLNISKKEMYSENYKALNTKLALITLPTKGLNKEERNALQDYIVKMDQDGYLDKAIQMAPGSRFVFSVKQLSKNALADFVLINQGVPRFYGTEPLNVIPVIIESKSGNISIRSAGPQPE